MNQLQFKIKIPPINSHVLIHHLQDSDEPRSESSDEERLMRLPMTNSLDRKKVGMARFTRDSLRSSLSSRPEMYRWLEAQQRAEEHSKASALEVRVKNLSCLPLNSSLIIDCPLFVYICPKLLLGIHILYPEMMVKS